MAAVFRAARAVYCVSRHNLRLLEWQLGVKLPNARVVWNPNQAAELNLLPWPAESGLTRLACVARLEPIAKGQDVLLQVLAHPAWRARPVELNLYGAGNYEKTLRALAGSLALAGVNFCGHLPNVADIWRANHLLVLPSRYEGMPLSLIEAMSCGWPGRGDGRGRQRRIMRGRRDRVRCLRGRRRPAGGGPRVGPGLRRAEWPQLGGAARARVLQIIPPDPVAVFAQLVEKDAGAR